MTIYPEIRLKKVEKLNWQVTENCLLNQYGIIINEGFQTDLVSSPRLLWFIIPPHGLASNAAVVHDYLSRSMLVRRKVCDDIFFELLKETTLPTWQCWAMYLFVRIFGWLKN
jgi:hypothetical protein